VCWPKAQGAGRSARPWRFSPCYVRAIGPECLFAPVFTGRTATFTARGAGVGHGARFVFDGERVFVLFVFDRQFVAGASTENGHGQRFTGGNRRLDFVEFGSGRAGVRPTVVGGVRLDGDLGRVGGLLGLRVAGLFFLVEEGRQRDGGQDSEDEH